MPLAPIRNISKKTLVIGASEKPERYSNMCIKLLTEYNHEVVAIANRAGQVNNVEIKKGQVIFEDIDTITLYINPKIQVEYYDYILNLKPKRIIFNPGTENPELARLATAQGIEVEKACTLVMLRLAQF
jgi:hypothetical protein